MRLERRDKIIHNNVKYYFIKILGFFFFFFFFFSFHFCQKRKGTISQERKDRRLPKSRCAGATIFHSATATVQQQGTDPRTPYSIVIVLYYYIFMLIPTSLTTCRPKSLNVKKDMCGWNVFFLDGRERVREEEKLPITVSRQNCTHTHTYLCHSINLNTYVHIFTYAYLSLLCAMR
jgi:hypothetical protein